MRVDVSNIIWDLEVDGEQQDVDLPSQMQVEIDAEPEDDQYMIEEMALDEVSNRTGWCVLSSTVTILSENSDATEK